MLLRHGKDPLLALIDLPEKLREAPHGLGPEDQVHVGVGLLHPLAHPLLLGHAAAEAQDHGGVGFLGVAESAQVAEDPVLRVLPHGAGVEEGQVGLRRVTHQGEAHLLQHPHELLAVRHVLLAAEGIHAGGGMGLPGLVQRADLLGKLPLALDVRRRDQNVFPFQGHILPVLIL